MNQFIKGFIIVSSMTLTFSGTKAQSTDSLHYRYNNSTLYRKGTFYMKGNERLRFQELKKEFDISPVGLDLYMKSMKMRKLSKVFSIASMFTGLAAISIISTQPQKNTTYLLIGGQMALGIFSMQFRMQSSQYLDQAIWQRNKDVLFPGK